MRTINFTKQNKNSKRKYFPDNFILLLFLFIATNTFSQITVDFSYTGAAQTWTVPSGVTSLDIEVWGAQGGIGFLNAEGGLGGYASGTLAVTSGQALYIYVGGKGGTHASDLVTGGGFNGGGDSRAGNHLVGAGGGGSDVRVGGNSFSDRVIVGGGGGGACSNNYTGGNGGGTTGIPGANSNSGGGGSQTSGGLGPSCENGEFGIGGSSTIFAQCAGGGGGWYGGAAGCGAGGGSGYIGGVTNGTMNTGVRSGNGLVKIHYNTNLDNDICLNATPISCGDVIFDNTEGTGVDNPPACGVSVGTSGGLWYSFVGTGEDVIFSTCNAGTDFNTQLSIYIGTCDELICVDANDNGAGCNDQSQLTISTIVGAFYRILVNGAAGAEGNFELSVICPPDNDEPVDALPISCGNTVSGSTIGASSPPGNVPFCVLQNGTDGAVWYTFEGDGGCFKLTTSNPNTNFNSQITVYSGSPGNLICYSANGDGCLNNNTGSTVNFSTLPDTEYYVMIHGCGASEGNFELDFTCFIPPIFVTCPPDVALACGAAVPPAATNRVEFIEQGGSILGGSCIAENDTYTITHEDLYEVDICSGTLVERIYYVTNTITELEAICEQFFTIPPDPDFSIICSPGVDVECAEDINVSNGDVTVMSYCPIDYQVDIDGPVINGKPNCPKATYTYTYTVTLDGCGAQLSCSRTFTIVNNSIPEITCPADITVSCEDEINLDPNDAIVTTSCGAGYNVYIRNPTTWGVPGCNGTMYKYEYVVVDACQRKASCIQMVTINNTPATINVPVGGVVECFEDININIEDATVTNDCADYDLYLTAPKVNGELGCPGSTYTFTYRMIDVCGNVVEEDVVFTNADNEAPSIEAPLDATFDCLASINPNPDHAIITTGCSAGSTVTVSGPQIIGPIDCPGTRYVYTYTVSDNCGRIASDVQTFTVQNSSPVFVNCEEDTWLQFNCEDYGGEEGTIAVIEAYIASVKAYSACGNQLDVFNDFNSNDINTCINNGISTINFFATDDCGRTSTCQTTYVVVDTEAPVIYEAAQDHWEICNYNSPANFQNWIANYGNAAAFDECSSDNFSWSTIPANPVFNCMGNSGITSVAVTFVATDNCGNSATTTATFNAFMNGNGMVSDETQQAMEERGEIEKDQEIDFETGFTPEVEMAGEIILYQNRPNPFKDETVIGFHLPEASTVTLTIFDINGKVLKRIENNYSDGYNEVSLNKTDFNSIGVLYYQLMTKQESIIRSMIIVE